MAKVAKDTNGLWPFGMFLSYREVISKMTLCVIFWPFRTEKWRGEFPPERLRFTRLKLGDSNGRLKLAAQTGGSNWEDPIRR